MTRLSPPRPPLRGSLTDSFAYITIRDRIPIILTKAIDQVYRDAHSGEKSSVSSNISASIAKSVVEKLAVLKYEIQHDKVLTPFPETGASAGSDAKLWNEMLSDTVDIVDGGENTWFKRSWLFIECYMYRRVQQAFLDSDDHIIRHYDIFAHQKQNALKNSSVGIIELINLVGTRTVQGLALEAQRDLVRDFLQFSLWGNMADLSLHAHGVLPESTTNQHQLSTRSSKIIVDHTEMILDRLFTNSNADGRIDIVLDNAGFEFFTDLMLADILLQLRLAKSVVFHTKCYPWFVSDTTRRDIEWTMQYCESLLPKVPNLSSILQRWRDNFNTGAWIVKEHEFWTLPCSFWDMPTVAPDLYDNLKANSKLVLFKGDLNYRKLVYDCQWPVSTPFETAIGPLHGSLPLATLRTCKSDVAVGVEKDRHNEIEAQDAGWMVNGKWGLVQCSFGV